MGYKMTKKEYVVLETGTYPARVKSVEQEDGKFGEQAKFVFELDDSDEQTLTAWASATYSVKTKLGRWVSVLLGGMPDEFDTDLLIDRPCRITVLLKTKDDGTQYNRVDDVLPVKTQVKPVSEAPASDAAVKQVEQAAALAAVAAQF